jgi:TPR repeat protein
MYDNGQGVPQDDAEAVRWYRKAAGQGDPSAQYNLGLMYAAGQGVPQDYVEAHMWLNLAASRAAGDDQKKFADLRELFAKKMTAQQIAEAQRRAREWKPRSGENMGAGPVK